MRLTPLSLQGSNADAVLTDSYVKGIREGIDWKDGLAAMIKDAEVVGLSLSALRSVTEAPLVDSAGLDV